jgi:hypothetical protein
MESLCLLLQGLPNMKGLSGSRVPPGLLVPPWPLRVLLRND